MTAGARTYWATGTIASSLRAYYERVKTDPPMQAGRRLPVPTGVGIPRVVANFPPRRAPREMIESGSMTSTTVRVDLPSGGHFASWEEPELVAASIRAFFAEFR